MIKTVVTKSVYDGEVQSENESLFIMFSSHDTTNTGTPKNNMTACTPITRCRSINRPLPLTLSDFNPNLGSNSKFQTQLLLHF